MAPECTPEEWDSFLSERANVHILQSRPWGDLKGHFGWQSQRVLHDQAGAQILYKTYPGQLKLAYVPKGPVGPWDTGFLEAISQICRAAGAFVLKLEPDDDPAVPFESILVSRGFQLSPHSVQPRRTLIVDLTGGEEQILGRMHQKTRYNIRLAQRKGVRVRVSKDIDAFSNMMEITSTRDRFGVHTRAYYQSAFDLFAPHDRCALLMADHEGQDLAAVMVFASGSRAWYFYGASTSQKRNLMGTYLVQWEAMRWARERGCLTYDLWGVPDFELEQLESQFPQRSDGLWGVYRFKRGFGGKLIRSRGTWDRPLRTGFYSFYRLYTRYLLRS